MPTTGGKNDDNGKRVETQLDPAAFGEWFANASEKERREFADRHGDATAHKRNGRR